MAADLYAPGRRSNDHSPMLWEDDLRSTVVLEGDSSSKSKPFFAIAVALLSMHFLQCFSAMKVMTVI